MMSKLKRRTSVVCSLLLAVVMVMPLFAGCGADNKPPEGEKPETHCTVTFDKNTSRNTNVLQPQTVENGKTVKAPTVITIDDNDPDASNRYAVIGWYTSSECKENEKWNFATPVTKSMTLYAAWQEKVKVEFFLDPNGQTANSTQWVIKGQKAEREDGLVGNYKLEGYFTSNDFAESSAFDFNTALNADTKLYLKYDASKAYLTATHLASMTFGYDKHYVYESKYCPEHRKEVKGEACTEADCTAELVDPASVTTKYCPDCKQDVEESAVEEGKHLGCTAETETASNVEDPAGAVAAKQRPEGFYPATISKNSEEGEDGKMFDYATFDFGNLEQPYAWYNPLNIDIKGKNELSITYRNVGKGRVIRFYYVMAYAKEGGGYTYSGNGGFLKFVDINIEAGDGNWHTATVDMGAKTISETDGISEWGTADLLSIFRIDYPYKSNGGTGYEKELVKPGDSVLEVKEIAFAENGEDYTAKDTLNFKDDQDYTTEAPANSDWTWSVAEGGELYYKDDKPTAFFPYGSTANTVTATATESNAIDCDSDAYKAITINYDNLGYGTSAKVAWKTSTSEGFKNVSLDARANGKTIYINMAAENSWSGTLESLTLTYQTKGVDNAITVNSVTINAPKPEDVPGVSFKYSKSGFVGEYNIEKASMVVDNAGISKTAEANGTVLDVDNAIVYKGFTVWYTQGETAATELTLTYTDEEDQEHSQKATLTSGEDEKKATFTFLNNDNRSAMNGKIKNLTVATDKGSVFVTYIYFDFDVSSAYFDMTKAGAPDSNFANALSTRPSWAGNGASITYSDEKTAWYFANLPGVNAFQGHWIGLASVSVDNALKERKMYMVVNNPQNHSNWNVFYWFTGSGGPGAAPFSNVTVKLAENQRNMGDNEWTVVEITFADDDTWKSMQGKELTGVNFFNNDNSITNVYVRAIIFR